MWAFEGGVGWEEPRLHFDICCAFTGAGWWRWLWFRIRTSWGTLSGIKSDALLLCLLGVRHWIWLWDMRMSSILFYSIALRVIWKIAITRLKMKKWRERESEKKNYSEILKRKSDTRFQTWECRYIKYLLREFYRPNGLV